MSKPPVPHERRAAMNARVARTSEGSHLCAACAENHQGSPFLSAAAPVHVVPSSPPPPPPRCVASASPHTAEASRLQGRTPTPADTHISTLLRRRKSLTARAVRSSTFHRAEFPCGGVWWGGREPVVGDGAFEQHSFRRKTDVVAQSNGGVSQGQFSPSLLFS